MRSEVRDAWVAALRSGEFRQGRSVLRWDDDSGASFCCLGVLCELAVRAGVVSAEKRFNPSPNDPRDSGVHTRYFSPDNPVEGNGAALPKSVQAWAGLDSSNPDLGGTDAMYLNDGVRASFAEIADLIERHL
jgi:hypothetical protein